MALNEMIGQWHLSNTRMILLTKQCKEHKVSRPCFRLSQGDSTGVNDTHFQFPIEVY